MNYEEQAIAMLHNSAGMTDNSAMQTVLNGAEVFATLEVAHQLRIANRLKVAELDLTTSLNAHTQAGDAFRIRGYLNKEDWSSLEFETE